MIEPQAFLEAWARITAKPFFPDFDPRAIPVMVFDGFKTYLFNAENAPDGFSRASAWFSLEGRFEGITANTSADGVAQVMANEALEAVFIGVHEAFHVFQTRVFPHWGANEAEMLSYPVENAENLWMRRVETRALHHALEHTDAASALEALRWRARRFASLSEGAIQYERELERYEGLAFAVELKARGQPHRLPAHDFDAERVRFRAYATGQALARLLETWQPDFTARVNTTYLDELLALALERTSSEPRFTPTDVIEHERERASLEVRMLERQRLEAKEAFLTTAVFRLEIESHSPLFPQGFDPMNVQRVSSSEVLHSRFLRLGNEAGHLQTLGSSALSVGTDAHPLFNGVRKVIVALPQAPVQLESAALELRAEGFECHFEHATLEQASGTWRIKLP